MQGNSVFNLLLDAMTLLSILGRYGDAVEEAEPHRSVRLSVMSWWPADQKKPEENLITRKYGCVTCRLANNIEKVDA